MSEEIKKPDRVLPGQIIIGDENTIDVDRTSDLPDSTSNFDIEATREEEIQTVSPKPSSSLGAKIEPGIIIDDRYRLVFLAGNGATGQVWHAYDLHMGYGVAIKLISPKYQSDPEVLNRFRDSFKVVHDLHHRYICPINHMGNDERFGWYLVMQWMPETLSSFRQSLETRKKNMSPEMIHTIVSMLAEGLDYVHELRIIHRDIKPANIVISRNKLGDFSTAQLIDFGLSQDLDEADDDTVACGTPAYMAPEQWNNSFQDGKTDQYALAMVAYELYCGHPAFSATSYELMRATVLNDSPAPIPDLPLYVNQALLKALSKNRDDRYASCTEFAKALAPPPTFFEKNVTGILSVTVLFLAVCLFSMFSFLHPAPYTQQVLTFSQTERDLTFGNPDDRLSFLVVQSEDEAQAESDDSNVPVQASKIQVPSLTLGNQVIDITKPSSGEGWTTTAMKDEELVVTLTGYTGGAIKGTAMNLKVVLADGSNNIVKSSEGHIGLELHDGNLTVIGATQGTGTLSVTCEEPDSCSAAVFVGGKRKFLTLERFASFHIQAYGNTDGILVEHGNVNFRRIGSVKIDCSKNRNAVFAVNMSVIAGKDDLFDLAGGLCLSGPLSVFDSKKPDVRLTRLPFKFKLCDVAIDCLAGTQSELIEALASVSVDTVTVILLTDDIETSPRGDDANITVSMLSVERGHHVLLSSGHRIIRKGPEHSRDEELLYVKGRLSLGSPSGMGTSTILIDGGCERELDAQEPLTFNYEDGRVVEVAKYKVTGSSAVALISVNGFLAMYDGAVIANNVNPKSIPERNNADFDYARGTGGVFVEHAGVFEMFGGRIQNCESPYGAGVCVKGLFRLKGGEIIGNTCNNGNGESSPEGGGVYVTNGSFEMSGGTICNNFALSKASDARGTASAKGAGVHLSFGSLCKLTGGVIRDNHSMWAGGGVYVGGRGTSILEVSENARIENNTAVVGAGIFMNAPVKMSGGSISGNTLLKGPSATLPAGSGVYFLPMSNISGQSFPCLFLSGKALIAPDNRIFISSANRINSKELLLFDERFYPIIVTRSLTGDPVSQRFTVDGGTFVFSQHNSVPLVGLLYIKAGNDTEVKKMLERFSFGFLGGPENNNFKLVSQTIDLKDVVTGKVRKDYCLSVTPK